MWDIISNKLLVLIINPIAVIICVTIVIGPLTEWITAFDDLVLKGDPAIWVILKQNSLILSMFI